LRVAITKNRKEKWRTARAECTVHVYFWPLSRCRGTFSNFSCWRVAAYTFLEGNEDGWRSHKASGKKTVKSVKTPKSRWDNVVNKHQRTHHGNAFNCYALLNVGCSCLIEILRGRMHLCILATNCTSLDVPRQQG